MLINEMKKRFGISRRAIDGYIQLGLIKEGIDYDTDGARGQRDFKPDGVRKVQIIQLLNETGNPLKEIKGLLDSPTENGLEKMIDTALDQLEEEKTQIIGKIRYLNIIKATFSEPDEVMEQMTQIDISRFFTEKVDFEAAKKARAAQYSVLANADEEGLQFIRELLQLLPYIHYIGKSKGLETNDPIVIKRVEMLADKAISIGLLDQYTENMSPEYIKEISDCIDKQRYGVLDYLGFTEETEEIAEIAEQIEDICGSGAWDHIKRSIQDHMNRIEEEYDDE